MEVHTLQAGEELVLAGRARVTVLAIQGDTVLLGLAEPENPQVVALELPEGPTLLEAAQGTWPSNN
jgi:hypothetical protein